MDGGEVVVRGDGRTDERPKQRTHNLSGKGVLLLLLLLCSRQTASVRTYERLHKDRHIYTFRGAGSDQSRGMYAFILATSLRSVAYASGEME